MVSVNKSVDFALAKEVRPLSQPDGGTSLGFPQVAPGCPVSFTVLVLLSLDVTSYS